MPGLQSVQRRTLCLRTGREQDAIWPMGNRCMCRYAELVWAWAQSFVRDSKPSAIVPGLADKPSLPALCILRRMSTCRMQFTPSDASSFFCAGLGRELSTPAEPWQVAEPGETPYLERGQGKHRQLGVCLLEPSTQLPWILSREN